MTIEQRKTELFTLFETSLREKLLELCESEELVNRIMALDEISYGLRSRALKGAMQAHERG